MKRKFKAMTPEELEAKDKELEEINNKLRDEGKLEQNGGLLEMPINYQMEKDALTNEISDRSIPEDVQRMLDELDNGKRQEEYKKVV